MSPSDDSNAVLEEKLRQWSKEATADFKARVMPGRWLQMEAEHGSLKACKLILTPQPEGWWTEILTSSWERRRLKWSVEAIALNPEFASLFTDQERAVARARLEALGYDPSSEWWP